jgi:membrane protease YdiL (CAAX protease family)
MSECLMDELLKFDPTKPISSPEVQIIATIAIMIISNCAFRIILKCFPINIESEKSNEYESLQSKNISLFAFASSEFFNGTLYAPIAEELVFRFFLLKTIFIRRYKLNSHVANILQAIIFGALHMTNSVYSEQVTKLSILQSFSSAIIGLCCGYAYMYTNSILPALFAHMLNNLNSSVAEIQNYESYQED